MRVASIVTTQIGLLIAAFALVAVTPLAAAEDEAAGETVKAKAQKRRGTGDDENITSRSVENKSDEEAPAPPDKGGDAERGSCYVVVDNYTPWKIQIFMDGRYQVLLSPWGKGYGWYSPGRHKLYGLAEFVDAADMTWGPQRFNCRGSFTWSLFRD